MSCRREDSADASPIFPLCWLGGTKWDNGPISGGFQGPIHPQISYETRLTCRLTGQGQKWEPALK